MPEDPRKGETGSVLVGNMMLPRGKLDARIVPSARLESRSGAAVLATKSWHTVTPVTHGGGGPRPLPAGSAANRRALVRSPIRLARPDPAGPEGAGSIRR
jgi:hypothetical protein